MTEWTLQQGDCRQLMAAMPRASVESVVTDPPYEMDFMGREWDRSGVAFQAATWREAYRVLKPGGFLLAFGGARTYHRLACAVEDAGFEIRDQIMWIYGSGFPKGGNRDGKGTSLKPAHEPIVMARKPCVGSARENMAAFGTGGLNIDECRVSHGEILREGAGIIPMRHDPAVPRGRPGAKYDPDQAGTLSEFDRLPGGVPRNPAGRWPANVIHDGSDEVVGLFPAQAGAAAPVYRRGGDKFRSTYGAFAGHQDEEGSTFHGDTGSAARFFYCAKASRADRDEGLEAFAPQQIVQFQTGNGASGEPSSWSADRDTQYRNIHPTVKPEALMRYLVRLVTPAGGVVLDPFAGSGSTGKAALLERCSFVGCELTAEYVPIAEARILAAGERARVEGADTARRIAPPPPVLALPPQGRLL